MDPDQDGGEEEEGEAGICGRLFRGLVFFVGREVPQEQLLLVIRSFGGTAAWDGPGSPLAEADESITHQVGPLSAAPGTVLLSMFPIWEEIVMYRGSGCCIAECTDIATC